ncbi:MAG: response regulator [Anaerolineae bacterium]|nr:response regulator [Anaerolineae bacterium]
MSTLKPAYPARRIMPVDKEELNSSAKRGTLYRQNIFNYKLLKVLPRENNDMSPTDLPLIMLSEDNEANIKTISIYLQAKGFRVVVARNGVEAIEQAQRLNPNLILMDIHMPQMDGLAAMRELRGNASFSDIPIIALTALAMPGDREKCLAAGATEYLSKPVSLQRLVEVIEANLTKRPG